MKENNYIKMTYNNYISMSSNPTKKYLMISELIDNSIGSFESKLGEDFRNWPIDEKVIVKINIEIHNKNYGEEKEIHNQVINEDSKIVVEDNAFGMNKEVLYKSIEIDNKKITKFSNKNIHGRGMKQSAFYFGMGLKIETNNDESSYEMTVDMTKVEDLSSPFLREIKNGEKKDRGTCITLFNLYDSKIQMKKNQIDKIIESIKTRYWEYIKSGKLVIIFKSNVFDKEREINKDDSLPLYLEKESLLDFYNKENIENAKKEVINKIENFKFFVSEKSTIDKPSDENIALIKDTLKKMYASDGEYKWKYENVNIGYLSKIKLNFYFWKNGSKKNYSPYRGIYIFEGGRAIKHGPDSQAYTKWIGKKSHGTGSTDNKFFGSFDITNIEQITAINDKSDISFKHTDIKSDLDSFIYWNWKIFDEIENFIRKNEDMKSKNFDNLSIQKTLINRYNSSDTKIYKNLISSEEITVDENKKLKGDFRISNEKWSIVIKPDESTNIDSEKYKIITDFYIFEDKKEIRTTYNEYAYIWNRANKGNSTHFYSEVLYPIMIQLTALFINNIYYKKGIKNSINNFNVEEKNKNDNQI